MRDIQMLEGQVMDRETLNTWYSKGHIPGVYFHLNDAVTIRDSLHMVASIISLESISPEPSYLLEYSNGKSEVVMQSALGLLAYVELLDEGAYCLRPVAIEKIEPDRVKIIAATPDDEKWAVQPGHVAKIVVKTIEGREIDVVSK